ncbi:TRO [Symbiodinium sp. CCMP2592]|nr:TRO [Symbiodinium sp. CCMP2592]
MGWGTGEALLSNFSELVKCSQKQHMKSSHLKDQLSKVADHWCHRTLAAAVGADCISYKLLRDMAHEAQRIFVAKAKESSNADSFTAATFLRQALPETRQAWRAKLVQIQGETNDDSWKQWLESWETPSLWASFEGCLRGFYTGYYTKSMGWGCIGAFRLFTFWMV